MKKDILLTLEADLHNSTKEQDPKETWAFVTAAAYLVYIHLRLRRSPERVVLWTLPIAFLLLMVTWIGVNYLPSAQGGLHTYG